MKILITGTKGLSQGLYDILSHDHEVNMISRTTGYDIKECSKWANEFKDFDLVVNCCYSDFGQVNVLTEFVDMWKDDASKAIINIGSAVTSYSFTEVERDYTFVPYRMHKLALSHAFEKLTKTCKCHLQLISPGLFDTPMVKDNPHKKMPVGQVANYIVNVMFDEHIKRIDFWE